MMVNKWNIGRIDKNGTVWMLSLITSDGCYGFLKLEDEMKPYDFTEENAINIIAHNCKRNKQMFMIPSFNERLTENTTGEEYEPVLNGWIAND